MRISIISLCLVLWVGVASAALTPIARVNVVPYQRIEYDTTFKFGTVAFSKAGIDRVVYTISGQGYSGGAKTVTSMTLNDRTDTYEYWVGIASSEFTSSGPIIVTAVAYGDDGGVRNIGSTSLVVDHDGNFDQPEVWISTAGSDSTGTVDDRDSPYLTVAAAITDIETATGGESGGAIVYFMPGSYSLGSFSPTTTDEFLILTHDDATGSNENVIFVTPGVGLGNSPKIKVQGVEVRSSGALGYVFNASGSSLWIDHCRIIGVDRTVGVNGGGNPIGPNTTQSWWTNTYVTETDRGTTGRPQLARNVTMEVIGEDAYQNVPFVVNARVDDIDPLDTGDHSDGYQLWGDGKENFIIFGYYGTNMHYQGLFARALSLASNNAFVNVFMEMRDPGRPGDSSGILRLTPGSLSGPWEHLLLWNCTFVGGNSFGVNGYETAGRGFVNSSFIGNFFYQFADSQPGPGNESPQFLPGNIENNDVLYNHYVRSFVDVENCGGTPQPEGCPQYHTKSPDSSPTAVTETIGGRYSTSSDYLNMSDTSTYVRFGEPITGSFLINRIPFPTIPVDALGTARTSTPTVGALEIKDLTPLTCSNTHWMCTTQVDCESASWFWYNDECNAEAGSTCSDGFQNGDETGVDCGGSCDPCDPVLPLDTLYQYKFKVEGKISIFKEDTP